MPETPNLKAIFAHALALASPAERKAYLMSVCGDDAALRQEVESLLDAHVQANGFLSRAASQLNPTVSAPAQRNVVDRQIGCYKIRERIGEGGMGEVYVAEQHEPVRRKVALKIIKPGMASKDIVARFQAERQALAMMDHPNIASVLDGGTTDTGQPYFVMELVLGFPITEYCDRERLSTTERLRLLVKVCRAVQHAHQKGVIHRDIKPNNVLVSEIDGEAVPKVIDFGVAKAVSQKLTEDTIYTRLAQVVGTPLYMSPEQAKTGVIDIDTRSDVYSLGVLLYELLTGNPPFDRSTLKRSGFEEFRRILREEEPRRPSQVISTLNAEALSTVSNRRSSDPRKLVQTVRGELDWIVMKALEKDRTRRYETANGLARDVERYLEDEPVEACPPTIGYRIRKTVTRYRGLLTIAALFAAMLMTATGVSVGFAIQANRAKNAAVTSEQAASTAKAAAEKEKEKAEDARYKAEKNFAMALEAVDKLLEHASDPLLSNIPRVQPIRRNILSDALAFYDQFAVTSGDSPQLRCRAAAAHRTLGDSAAAMGEYPIALRALVQAVKICEELAAEFPEDSQYLRELARAYQHLGWHYRFKQHDNEKALAAYTQAEETRRRLAELDPGRRDFHRLRAVMALRSKAETHLAVKNTDKALELLQEAQRQLAHLDAKMDEFETLIDVNRSLVRALVPSDPDRAESLFLETMELSRQRIQAKKNRRHEYLHVQMIMDCEDFLRGRSSEQYETFMEEAVTLADQLVKDFPAIVLHHKVLDSALRNLIQCQLTGMSANQKEDLYAKYLDRFSEHSVVHELRADLFVELQQYDRALADLIQAIELSTENSHYVLYRAALLAAMLENTERYRKLCRKAIKIFTSSENVMEAQFTAWMCALVAGALDDYGPALKLAEKAVAAGPEDPQLLTTLGAIQMRAGRFDAALKTLERAADCNDNENVSVAYTAYFRAMTEQQMQRSQEAKRSLNGANTLANQEMTNAAGPLPWNRLATLKLLRREAEALTGPTSGADDTGLKD